MRVGNNKTTFLLASSEPVLLAAIEPVLLAAGVRVEVVLTAQAALSAMSAASRPDLVLLDVELPGMPMGQLLAALRAETAAGALSDCSDFGHCDAGVDRPAGRRRHR